MRQAAFIFTFLLICSDEIQAYSLKQSAANASQILCSNEPEWITILVHGTVGFHANFSYKTVLIAQNDCTEGSDYERNVLSVRENDYLFALQPMQELGLQPVRETDTLRGAYVFKVLYEQIAQACGVQEKGHFYTFGWTGIVSFTRRMREAIQLRAALKKLKRTYPHAKIRILAYSHGASLVLNLATIQEEFLDDFIVDELFLIGFPVTSIAHKQITSPIFKKIYSIYSRQDKVQRLDIFSPCDFFSHREFKGKCLPEKLIQIEMKFNACLKRKPGQVLPQRMRETFNQSPGHIELWFFGWAPSSYRQNLYMYPLPGAAFIPYLVCAANQCAHKRLIVDIRPQQEVMCISSRCGKQVSQLPFLSQKDYDALITKAMQFHPSNPKYKEHFEARRKEVKASQYE